jgi:hypothetical protein
LTRLITWRGPVLCLPTRLPAQVEDVVIHYPEPETTASQIDAQARIGDRIPAMFERLITLLVMICCANPASGQVSQVQLRPILDLLQGKQYLSSQTDEYHNVLTELLSKSGSRLALNINNGLRDNSINFLLLAPDVNEKPDLPLLLFTPLAQAILHNCNYVGISNTIVCSQDFIDGFFTTYLKAEADVRYLPGKHPPRPDDLSVATARRAFLFWVLGHELGHLAHGDVDSHFATPLGLQEFATADELQQDKELRADAYCADLAVKPSSAAKPVIYVKILEEILIALANDEVITRHLAKGQGPGLLKYYSSGELIEYRNQGNHPEYVIRATRMLKILADLTKDPALASMTDSFQLHLKQSAPPGDH